MRETPPGKVVEEVCGREITHLWRGDEDSRVPPERVPGRQRLIAEDVEGRGGELTSVERRDQILFDKVGATAGIYEAGAFGQQVESAGIVDHRGLVG